MRAQLAMCHSVEPRRWPDVAPALIISATMGAMELRRVGSRFLRLYLLYLLGYNIMHCTISTVSTVSTVSTISTVSSRNYEDNETPAPVLTLIPTLQLERKGWAKR